jgi:hypothetical protein
VPSQRAFHKQGRVASQSWLPQRKIRSGDLRSATLGASALGSRALTHLPDLALRDASFFFLYRIKAAAGIGGACGLGANPTPDLWGRLALHLAHANTAGLHASAAMGLSGRLLFDSSNRGLC